MANIFRLIKLARTAYKAAPVVIPLGLAVAKYAMDKIGKRDAANADMRSGTQDGAASDQAPAEGARDRT